MRQYEARHGVILQQGSLLLERMHKVVAPHLVCLGPETLSSGPYLSVRSISFVLFTMAQKI